MRKLVLLFGIISLASCSPVKIISSESTQGFALANYKTFNFVEIEFTGEKNPFFDERLQLLKTEFGRQLALRGVQPQGTDPDLFINIGVVVEEKIQTRQTDFRTDARYMGQRNYTWESQEVPVNRYKDGTITLHLIDRKKNAMVWRGVANGVVPNKDKNVKETIVIGVEELMKKVN